MGFNGPVSQGMSLLSDTIIHVENALIEEVVTDNGRTGHILIAFGVSDNGEKVRIQEIRLNVGADTVIIDEKGVSLNLYYLERGMRISAEFSAAMTRSIPPQAYAYRIVLLQNIATVTVTTDRVVGVDEANGFLLVGSPYDMYDQIIFTISNDTVILDRYNNPIQLEELQPGQMVRVEHAIFQTLSIPPQSPAYRVQVI